MSDSQEPLIDEPIKKTFLRSQNIWKVGDKFPVSYVPSVEGMVVSTRWIENVLMVVFLAPPFAREEGTWAEAALLYKPTTSLCKKPLNNYDHPFPSDPRILEEVKKANGSPDILNELVKYLNKKFPSPQLQPDLQSGTGVPSLNWNVNEQEEIQTETVSDRLSVQLLLSQQADEEFQHLKSPSDQIIEKIVQEVTHRLSIKDPGQQKSAHLSASSKKKKKKDISSSSSSSKSSNSDSDSSSSSENVGISENEEKGWCICPFSSDDVRTTAEPKKKMQGRAQERVMLRKALHNIYSEYHTLKSFVEIVRTDSLSSSARPYGSDILWLTYHASYLDLLLLHAIEGPWHSWNELVVDALTKSVLELLVRSSTNRIYPEILDERVRKWMKRKRVGISAHFGPIPNFLQNAKITDSGIHPKGGWDTRNTTSNKNFASTSSASRLKGQNGNAEKKP